jgi:glycolate oxidase FAD binding subunit
MPTISPSSLGPLRDALLSSRRCLPTGGLTKPALSTQPGDDVTPIDARSHSGIVAYDPEEFTITARAGTSIAELSAALTENGQYLPSDPPLAAAGATLGGTIAANLNGARALRYGRLRDFVLSLSYLDGEAQLIRTGARVVKNAAGYDFPKFFCGSLGRLGLIVEATLKVFPDPPLSLTITLHCDSPSAASQIFSTLACLPLDWDALDYQPAAQLLIARLASRSQASIDARLAAAAAAIGRAPSDLTRLDPSQAELLWQRSLDFSWAAHGDALAKLPLPPAQLVHLDPIFAAANISRTYSMAGNVAHLAGPAPAISSALQPLGLRALWLRGAVASPWIGTTPLGLAQLKARLDPSSRFLPFPT